MKSIFIFCCIAIVYNSLLFAQTTVNKNDEKLKAKKTKTFLKNGNYVYVPAGSYINYIPGLPGYSEERQEVISVDEFFMLAGEVTNGEYLSFVNALLGIDNDKHNTMLPDTTVWRVPLAYNEPYVEYYLRHPAYQAYPVVGVSYYQAQAYCSYLTETYNAFADRAFAKVLFRLPTEKEWIYAAKGGNKNAVFPWEGNYSRKANGDVLANSMHFGTENVLRDTLYKKNANGEFEQVIIYRAFPGGDYMGVAGRLSDGADVTAPSISYWPNGYGLCNMAGNVAEMVQEIGITHGGSWNDPGYYMYNSVKQNYVGENSSSNKRGFRVVMEVIEW